MGKDWIRLFVGAKGVILFFGVRRGNTAGRKVSKGGRVNAGAMIRYPSLSARMNARDRALIFGIIDE